VRYTLWDEDIGRMVTFDKIGRAEVGPP
jgi:hypothetical protein